MKCVSSCFSCLCGARNSSQISPSEPIQVIHPSHEKYRPSENGGEPLRNEGGNGSINPNFLMGDDDDGDSTNRDPRGGETVTDSPSSTLQAKALYIEVGKDRLLRVIHVPSLEEDEPSPTKSLLKKASTSSDKSEGDEDEEESSSPDGEKPPSENEKVEAVVEEDEEEYWFSKWARKPRFRSIFAKNPDQRPKLNNENNNNSNESNKVSVEVEMARAAAAARRRAWAYNNNGNCEPTITHQPSVNPNDEEEFSSIAIVNSNKQQWSKGNSSNSSEREGSPSSTGSPTVEVQVAVERQSNRSEAAMEGVSNPAFQDDDEEDQPGYVEDEQVSEQKTEEMEQNTSKVSLSSLKSEQSTASVKSSGAFSNSQEEDAITSEFNSHEISNHSEIGEASPNMSFQKDPHTLKLINAVPKKPLIFFIHSVSASSDVWRKQMEFFQQLGYEIVAPDLLGHGLSSTPLNPKYYYFESLVQDLILIFDHFTKDDVKVVLIGHGYGACLAAMLTRVRLKSISLLITIAGGGPTPLVKRTCCQDSWFSWKCKLFHSNRIRGRFDNPELKHILPTAIYKNVLSGQVWADGDSAFYRRVTVPTLLVYGMRDKVVTLVEECEMERTIPKSFLELIDSAGHMVMIDEPEKLNKMLCKFIQSWS